MAKRDQKETFVTRSTPLGVVEMVTHDMLNEVSDGDYTVTIGARPELFRDDGEPSEEGDILSVQEDGSLQTRPEGTDGAFERCRINGNLVVFRPKGTEGRTYGIPYAEDVPN